MPSLWRKMESKGGKIMEKPFWWRDIDDEDDEEEDESCTDCGKEHCICDATYERNNDK